MLVDDDSSFRAKEWDIAYLWWVVWNAASRLIFRLRAPTTSLGRIVSLYCYVCRSALPTRLPSWPIVLWPATYHSICGNSSVSPTSLLATDSGPLLQTTWSYRLFDWPPSAVALFQ